MSKSTGFVALLMLIAGLIWSAPGQAADAGYYGDPRSRVETAKRYRAPVSRYSERRRFRRSVEDYGVFHPYRTYWDRYPYRYFHDRYAYDAEPFPNGFWWW